MISMKVSRSYVWHDSSTCFASVCTRGYFDVWHMNHTDACVETLCVRRNSSCGWGIRCMTWLMWIMWHDPHHPQTSVDVCGSSHVTVSQTDIVTLSIYMRHVMRWSTDIHRRLWMMWQHQTDSHASCDMKLIHMRNVMCKGETRFIHMCHTWRDSSMCVTWYVWNDSMCDMCKMTHAYAYDLTHSCVTWIINMLRQMVEMTLPCVCETQICHVCVLRPIHMFHPYANWELAHVALIKS